MNTDVITIECSCSQMELLDVFADFKHPNKIGSGVYDIHSPCVPSRNQDYGLKTRHWEETKKALIEMVAATKEMRVAVDNLETV